MKNLIFFVLVVSFCSCSKDSADPSPAKTDNTSKVLFSALLSSNPQKSQLFTMNSDGSSETQLTNFVTTGSLFTGFGSWSPDGTQIVFVTSKDGNSGGEIYSMKSDGTAAKRLTNNLRSEEYPTYSKDGSKILYSVMVSTSPEKSQLFTMNSDGSGETQLTNFSTTTSLFTGYASWSPDGTQIVFVTNKDGNNNGGEIYSMKADGTNLKRLTNNQRSESSPTYSKDGGKILYSAMVSTSPEKSQLFTMNSDGTNESQLTNFSTTTSLFTGFASWSPDGSQIIFVTNKDGNSNGGEIYTMKADGTNLKRLTNNQRVEEHPKWK